MGMASLEPRLQELKVIETLDRDRLLDLPLGRINPALFAHAPKVKQVSGKTAAMVLMTAQRALDPGRMPHKLHKQTRSHVKPNAAARRAAKIAQGKLQMVDGVLVGRGD